MFGFINLDSTVINVFTFVCLLTDCFIAVSSAPGCVGGEDVLCKTCHCSADNSSVNCSYFNLIEMVENLPVNLIRLSLHGNNIEKLKPAAFRECYYISHLDLSNNKIQNLSDDIFKDMTSSLVTLHLQNNNLTLDETSNVLNLTNLKTLFIHQNLEISEKVFSNLVSLEHLRVSGSIKNGFGSNFSKMVSLKTLVVYPKLTHIEENTFLNLEKLKNLKYLDLSELDIVDIHKDALKHFFNLSSLNLGYNPKLGLPDVSESLEKLNSSIKYLILSSLRNSYRPVCYLDKFYSSLNSMQNLEYLAIDRNDLLRLDVNFLKSVKRLKRLDISSNRLSSVFDLMTFMFTLVNLTSLNANYQARRVVGNSDKKLRMKDIEKVVEAKREQKLRKTSFKSNYVADSEINCLFPHSSLSKKPKGSWCLPCPKNLQSCYLNGIINENMNELPSILFIGNCSFHVLQFGSNGIEKVNSSIIIDRPKANEPLQLDFSNNDINYFAPNVFKMSIENRTLIIGEINLEGNDLSDQIFQDKEGEIFQLYTHLVVLNLANNKLKQLNSKTFYNLINLQTLNLSQNFLQTLNIDFSTLPHIQTLDLSYNLFTKIDHSFMFSFNGAVIDPKRNSSLYLSNNPLQCTCGSLEFLLWIEENQQHIKDLDNAECLEKSKSERTQLKTFSSIIRQLKLHCNNWIYDVLGGLATMTLLGAFVLVILHKYKWDIRYCMLKHVQKRKQYKNWIETTSDYKYDAFISYDQNDRRWIVQHLIPNLERACSAEPFQNVKRSHKKQASGSSAKLIMDQEEYDQDNSLTELENDFFMNASGSSEWTADDSPKGFKFCIHERDFEPGNSIEANILEAIEGSRKVILVVSRHFVKSKWCRLELEMAKMESLERGRNVVVTVFLEPIKESLESLEWLIKRYTYLEWYKYKENSDYEEFWKKMKRALGNYNSKNVVCDCGKEFFKQ